MSADEVNVVAIGCTHGELDVVYTTVKRLEEESGRKVDLVLCLGDFQATRNESDLRSLAAPPQHLKFGDFPQYYSGEKRASHLTVLIGGNHEASAHFCELPHGGFVAPNLYYLGFSGVVTFAGLRIGGISGIHKPYDALKGHFECPPYDESSKRSVFHSRFIDAWMLAQAGAMDVMMSHDWPSIAASGGNTQQLSMQKRGLVADIAEGTLGCPNLSWLAAQNANGIWLSAHLHVAYAAILPPHNTRFLALDKPLPGRHFAHLLSVKPRGGRSTDTELRVCPLWAGVLRKHLPNVRYFGAEAVVPSAAEAGPCEPLATPIELPQSLFVRTARSHNGMPAEGEYSVFENPQTVRLYKLLGIEPPARGGGGVANVAHVGVALPVLDAPSMKRTKFESNEIDIDDDDDEVDDGGGSANASAAVVVAATDASLPHPRAPLNLPAPKVAVAKSNEINLDDI